MHAVYTPEDSIAFGFNVLFPQQLPTALSVFGAEWGSLGATSGQPLQPLVALQCVWALHAELASVRACAVREVRNYSFFSAQMIHTALAVFAGELVRAGATEPPYAPVVVSALLRYLAPRAALVVSKAELGPAAHPLHSMRDPPDDLFASLREYVTRIAAARST